MGFLKYQKDLVGLKFVGRTDKLINYYKIKLDKTGDWINHFDPKGGKKVFEGLPLEMAKLKDNHTAKFLKDKL
jgi:excinuclease ABC subunit A